MPANPFTPAELEAGVYPDAGDVESAALAMEAADRLGSRPLRRPAVYRALAYAGLAAVAPLIAARVRAEVAEEIAQAIATLDERGMRDGALLTRAAMTARVHRTTPGDDHDRQ